MLDPELINRITWKIPNALVLVGSRHGDEWNAMTTSWVTQVAMKPVLVAVGIDNTALTHRLIAAGGSFTVNLWSAEDTKPFRKFSKPADKDGMSLNGWSIREAPSGAPIFEEAIAWMDCVVRESIDCGTHTLFLGELTACQIVDDDARAASMADTRMKYGGVPRGGHENH